MGGERDPSDYKPDALITSVYLAAAESAGADVIITKPFGRDDIIKATKAVGIVD